ncbi:MAG: hypothetical protein M5U01_13780 [Ardenticatenaceae bacterium]|nr:hypothetical protein [Ardenticatenaceae bacterium]
MDRTRRLQLAHEIAARVQDHYNEHVLATGIYGSLAQGTDGPYSDIEMHCVVRGEGIDTTHEWLAGPWKAEVDVSSEDVLLREAAEVDVDWSITHGAFTRVMALHDPTDFFPRLRVVTRSQPDQAFQRAIREVIVGELYEVVGKVRNARATQSVASLPYFAVAAVKHGACLIGLANRSLYTTAARLFEESLALPNRPYGYDALCRMVIAGDLAEAARVADAVDSLWSGTERWAREHEIGIEEDLDSLLRS